MLHFDSDYLEGAHPAVLERLTLTNLDQTPGYGTDHFCEEARQKISTACQAPDASVYFLVGGTQTNAIVLDNLLKPWEGVVSADTGHIAGHEAGAIEACGHKILLLPHHNGKIDAGDLRKLCATYWSDANHEHMVAPGVVYLSHPSEYGTIYSLEELEAIANICHEYKMRLYLDGARLGYGLTAVGTDVTLPDIARLCDAFYIGGTKVGAMFGEAVVFTKPNADEHFFTLMKRRGALLAKGRILGLQFDALFTDDLYWSIARHAVDLSQYLASGLREKGYRLVIDSPTNQQFVELDNASIERLDGQATFGFWERTDDDHTVVRFATSWATRREDVDALLALM